MVLRRADASARITVSFRALGALVFSTLILAVALPAAGETPPPPPGSAAPPASAAPAPPPPSSAARPASAAPPATTAPAPPLPAQQPGATGNVPAPSTGSRLAAPTPGHLDAQDEATRSSRGSRASQPQLALGHRRGCSSTVLRVRPWLWFWPHVRCGRFQVDVTGGVYGIDASNSAADGPIISGSTFSGQTGSAIYYGASETLTVVGVKIDMAPQSTGPAIRCKARSASSAFLSVVDSQIEFPSYNQNNKAIASDRSVYTQNVYVDNAGTLYQVDQNALPGGSGWKWIQEAGQTVGSFPAPIPNTSYTFTIHAPIYRDRVRTTSSNVTEMGPDGTAPPTDLQSRHQWNATNSPSFDSPDAVNVKDPPYNAAGDGTTDDTQALQSAINAHDVVFLPKGYYRISKTLHLRSSTKLVGIAQNLSQIIPTDAGGFADTASPAPLVETTNDASATTSLAFVGLFVFRGHAGAYPLHWQAGKDSIFRTSAIIRRPEHGYGHLQGEVLNHPLVLIDGVA